MQTNYQNTFILIKTLKTISKSKTTRLQRHEIHIASVRKTINLSPHKNLYSDHKPHQLVQLSLRAFLQVCDPSPKHNKISNCFYIQFTRCQNLYFNEYLTAQIIMVDYTVLSLFDISDYTQVVPENTRLQNNFKILCIPKNEHWKYTCVHLEYIELTKQWILLLFTTYCITYEIYH